MTTDTFAKQVVVAGPGFTVGGMAKGAAMLAPHMVSPGAAAHPGHHAGRAHHRRRRRARPSCSDALADAVARSFNQLIDRRGHLDQRHRHRAGQRPQRRWPRPRAS